MQKLHIPKDRVQQFQIYEEIEFIFNYGVIVIKMLKMAYFFVFS